MEGLVCQYSTKLAINVDAGAGVITFVMGPNMDGVNAFPNWEICTPI